MRQHLYQGQHACRKTVREASTCCCPCACPARRCASRSVFFIASRQLETDAEMSLVEIRSRGVTRKASPFYGRVAVTCTYKGLNCRRTAGSDRDLVASYNFTASQPAYRLFKSRTSINQQERSIAMYTGKIGSRWNRLSRKEEVLGSRPH